ncbi:MAG: 2-isopropylmalate synthase [Alphaproteobacteria bacterium]|nr:2-isopropylmalate synthase [Alphaproteobacteria bacterium]
MDKSGNQSPANRVIIFDTTLRDGEQSPGATMSLKEKIAVAQMLDAMGVDVIEAGFAASSPGDEECIAAVGKAVKRARVCSLARAIKTDIEAAARALENVERPRIHTFVSTSPIHLEHQMRKSETQVLDIIDETVRYARSFCDDVEWSAMDATRTGMDYLMKAVGAAINAGASTINIPDTVGYTTPQEYQAMIASLVAQFPQVCFSAHCHDDLGMATANSLAAVKAGARQVECTINGIGERAGNAPLEEIVMAIKTRADFFGCETGIDTKRIYPISRFVASTTGFFVQKNKAIVGANAFAHESGIHQDGMLKNRDTYEIMRPETVGITQSQIVMGKHSGRAALKNKLAEWQIEMDEEAFIRCFDAFKALCDRKKSVTEEDLLTLIHDHQHIAMQSFVRLISYNTKQNGPGEHTADVVLEINGKEEITASFGDGTLDAIFQAVSKATNCSPQLHSYEVHSVSQGTDAQAEAVIILKENDVFYTGHARDTDTIMASARAYVGSINKIMATAQSCETKREG